MKILIVGAGIVGTIYGWAFAEAGNDVTHLVRPGKAARFKDGVQIDMYDVRKGYKRNFLGHYPIHVTETIQAADGYELVIVPTKHYHLLDALKQIVPQAGNTDYWLLTQNWEGTAAVDAILPPDRYVYGDAKGGGTYKGNTLIATISSVDIGQVGGRHDACLDKVLSLCRSVIPVTVHENILHYLWVQYAVTGGLWPALVKGGSLEAVLDNPSIGAQGLEATRECLEVIVRRGVDLKGYPETKMYLNSSPVAMWMAGLTMKAMFRFNKYMQRSSAHGLSDAQEIKTFYYDLLNSGRELGVPMPAMSAFEADIREFEPKHG